MQDLRRLAVTLFCATFVILQDAGAEVVSIATWNLEWFLVVSQPHRRQNA